jgi:hypothetical protein
MIDHLTSLQRAIDARERDETMNESTGELALFGHDMFGEIVKPKASGPLAERFYFPPFSVLDARQGACQERKRAWLSMGIESEVSRGESLTYRARGSDAPKFYQDKMGESWTNNDNGTSIFDPTLTEILYRWFVPQGGQILDPFAGGSVRGIVADHLGMDYYGIDLRPEQISANYEQSRRIGSDHPPIWIAGDSMQELDEVPDSDFVFSCPPYGDLEKYSDDPADLSTMEWHTFAAAYKRIIHKSTKALRPNRFAAFVVANFRDSKGHYRDLVGETVRAFEESGLHYYNEAVLVTAVGSAAMRATKQFDSGRKLCKTHQNVLVFVKGDWRKAAKSVMA